MSKQFKAGDMALTLVDDADIPAGSCVKLVRFIAKGEIIEFTNLRAPSVGWYVKSDHCCRNIGFGAHELMPLDGDQALEKEDQQELPA